MSGTQGRALVDKLLTNVSQGYFPDGYVADKVLPELNVVQQSGKIGKYGKEHLRIVNAVMGGKGSARRIETKSYASDSYYIDDHGLEDIVTQADYRNVEDPFDAEQDATIGLTSLMELGKEVALSSALTSTATISQNITLSGGGQFSDYANSDPISVVNTGKETIRANLGSVSDLTMIMDWTVANKLRFHPLILQSLGFAMARAGSLTDEELAKAFMVKRLLIADCQYLSSNEGQTDVMAPVWGKDIVLIQAPTSAAKRQLSAGYKVQYAGQGSKKVYKYAINNPPESNGILVKDDYDMLLTNSAGAYLIKSAIA